MSYSIKEAAAKAKIAPHTLRYYEEEKLLPYVKRDANGYRIYTDEDLSWIEVVSCLREANVSIADLKEMMSLSKGEKSALSERINILDEHRKNIQEQQKDLKQKEEMLDIKINHLKQLEDMDLMSLNKQKLC
ncbi:MerR family transcriptional regulator [Mammaliicoccus sp. Dog046]|uniref:MerR family transcriptional regulator n=1 Tax=Mammaliicoccus sp. Dog046 TaxID=3034233 RepID=UPI002B260324|nr:MerR family transcriptional regulator [Mammaliicoccus sp. Dog046]WQK86247.1 MerR family transcriptional regulator [Mammaliicoccus sp. Dog046]